MVETVRELRHILARQGHPRQAEVVETPIQLHESHPDEFKKLVQSVDMWGGPGARAPFGRSIPWARIRLGSRI
jgi:hypothetical protein